MSDTLKHIDPRSQSLPYYLAEQFAMHTNRPIFITGKTGTGKTTFLRKLRELSRTRGSINARLKKLHLKP